MTYEELISMPKQYRRLMRDTERVACLRETVTSLPPMQTNGRVQNGNVNRSMALVDTLIDAERDLQARTDDMKRMEKEALDLFLDIKEPEHKVLFLHYCRHLSITDISGIMFFTPRWGYMLRKRGLALVKEKINFT